VAERAIPPFFVGNVDNASRLRYPARSFAIRTTARCLVRLFVLGLIVCALALPARVLAWSWPTSGAVLRTFSFDPAHPYAAGQRRGIEIGGAPGDAVVAPAAGIV